MLHSNLLPISHIKLTQFITSRAGSSHTLVLYSYLELLRNVDYSDLKSKTINKHRHPRNGSGVKHLE